MEKYATNLEELVEEKTDQLREEKKRTDELLHQMLPRYTSIHEWFHETGLELLWSSTVEEHDVSWQLQLYKQEKGDRPDSATVYYSYISKKWLKGLIVAPYITDI